MDVGQFAIDIDDPRLTRRTFGNGDSDGRPRSISKAHRTLLDTFTAPVHERIREMRDEELWELIAACRSVSQTNCGWDAYAFARTYLDSATWEMKRRLASADRSPEGEDPQGLHRNDESAVAKPDAHTLSSKHDGDGM